MLLAPAPAPAPAPSTVGVKFISRDVYSQFANSPQNQLLCFRSLRYKVLKSILFVSILINNISTL